VTLNKLTLSPFMQFGFFQGGTIDISAQYTQGEVHELVYVIICSLTDLDNLLSEHNTIMSVCPSESSAATGVDFNAACQWAGELNSTVTSLSYDAPAAESDYYEFLYLNCNEAAATALDITYNLVNPGGENLSSGEIPFKSMSFVFMCMWAGVGALWLLNWLCQLRRSKPLHRMMGLAPVMQAAANGFLMTYWREMSATGVESLGLYLGTLLVTGCATATLLSLLVLVSKGYNITRPTLLRVEWRAVLVMASVFIIAYFTWQLMDGSFFFLFLLILVYILVLRFLFASIAANLRLLQFQIRFVHNARPAEPVSRSLPMRQFMAIRRFRAALAMFLGLYIMLHVWSMMALERSPWVEYLMVQGCTWMFVSYMLAAFRLQERSVYFTPEDSSYAPLLGDEPASDDVEAGAAPGPQAVIIMNPDTMETSGKVVRSVAVGVPTYATQATVVAVPGASPSASLSSSSTNGNGHHNGGGGGGDDAGRAARSRVDSLDDL